MQIDPLNDIAPASRTEDELAIFSTIVSAMSKLDEGGRVRLFKTLATFFDIGFHEKLRPSPSTESTVVQDRANVSQENPSGPTFSEDRAPSAKQFLHEKRPQTDVERIACLAYYLTHYRGQAQFKTLDLSKLNTEAAQIKFSNPAKAVDNAAQNNFLVQAGQGKKQISAIGELYVQALPDRTAARAAASEYGRRRNRPKSRASRPLSTRSEVAAENGADDESQ